MPEKIGNGLAVEKVVICEDVRPELGNKHTILGAIAGEIWVPQFPTAFKIAAYIDLIAETRVPQTVEVRWTFAGHEQISVRQQFTPDPPNHAVLFMPPNAIVASSAGVLALEIRATDKEWIEIDKRDIINPRPPASSSG